MGSQISNVRFLVLPSLGFECPTLCHLLNLPYFVNCFDHITHRASVQIGTSTGFAFVIADSHGFASYP